MQVDNVNDNDNEFILKQTVLKCREIYKFIFVYTVQSACTECRTYYMYIITWRTETLLLCDNVNKVTSFNFTIVFLFVKLNKRSNLQVLELVW